MKNVLVSALVTSVLTPLLLVTNALPKGLVKKFIAVNFVPVKR